MTSPDPLAALRPQSFPARALLVGDRIDLKSFSIADCLSTTPLSLRVGTQGGVAVLFRYGIVVFLGVDPMDETHFLATLQPLVSGPSKNPVVERLEVRRGSSVGVQGGVVSVEEPTLEALLVIADALSKSVMLSQYEARVQGEFDRVEPLAQELARQGRVSSGARNLLSKIGAMMLIQHRMVGRAEVGDKPETLWDHPRLESLYASLEDEFELRERQAALDRKLGLISDTARTLVEVWDTKQLHRMEWYVIGLIGLEIVINLFELGFRFGR